MNELPSSPSTRRSLAARLPGPLGRLATSLKRAVERGDPRLGLFVGVAVSALAALAFATRWSPAQRLDNAFLDYSFLLRTPIRESDRIVHVDMDDGTLREIGTVSRRHQAQVLTVLHRLGARQVNYDVEFKSFVPRTGQYDEKSGDLFLSEADRELRGSIRRAGNVLLAYSFDVKDPAGAFLARHPSVEEALVQDLSIGVAELSARSGVALEEFEVGMEVLRNRVLGEQAVRALTSRPGLSFSEFCTSVLKDGSPKARPEDLRHLQHAYWTARSLPLLEAAYPPFHSEASGGRPREGKGITPPLWPFLTVAAGGGAVNVGQDPGGVLRRPWCYLTRDGRPHFYLGFVAGIRGLVEAGESASVVAKPGRVEIEVKGEGKPTRTVAIPVDEEGRVLVNWAGKTALRRDWFTHVPFIRFFSFYEDRYLHLDATTRKVLDQLDEDEQKAFDAAGYVARSNRLSEILKGSEEKEVGEVRAIEAKLDAVRAKIMEAMALDIAESDKVIPKLRSEGKEQLAKRTKEARDRRQTELDGFRAPYLRERELKQLVEGKLCFIGAVTSADLHATPLGVTPGVDVLSNVANMILTGQFIRRGAAWVDGVFLFALGLMVSLAVTHWSTVGSLLSTVVLSGAATGVYWALFTGPSILISGAGPVMTCWSTFLFVVAFKLLVTQRSRRKLQRELEKSTSPEMVKILMEHPEFISKPRSMSGTFFFSDVKAFTTISEKMTPDVLFPFINRMLDCTSRALMRHQAYIDKYVGDGVVALFGMPVPSPDHARNACLAALDCQAGLKTLNEEFARESLPQIQVRIGVNSGDVKAGTMGAVDRSSYTAMG
ncbi:MAG TPA: CHASE2 domain-containing protein, partial [Planctomycetota bacterium]|nr:CHASE2 domain-containing protein [Planctomycetota bacterium]